MYILYVTFKLINKKNWLTKIFIDSNGQLRTERERWRHSERMLKTCSAAEDC